MGEGQAFYQAFRSLSKSALNILSFYLDPSVHNPKTIARDTSNIWQANSLHQASQLWQAPKS